MRMVDENVTLQRITRYMRYLEEEDTMYRGLQKLANIPISVELLAKTGVGKAVNQCKRDPMCGELASTIVKNWKKQAAREEEDRKAHNKRDRSPESRKSKSSSSRSRESRTPDSSPERRKKSRSNENVSSSSSHKKDKSRKSLSKPVPANDFEAMLSVGDQPGPPPPRKKIRVSINPADLDANYKPISLGSLTVGKKVEESVKPQASSSSNPDEYDPTLFKYHSHERQRVFAGRKKTNTVTHVDTLFNLALRTVGNHLDLLEETGDIPFFILKPVLEKCSTKQLAYIEERNPYLEEDADCLWEVHFTRVFPGEKSRHDETWKEAYFRMDRQRNQRLKELSERITTTHKTELQQTQRKAILSDAYTPRNVRKRQIANGITKCVLPSALEMTRARKAVFDTGSKAALNQLPAAVKNVNSSLGSSSLKRKDPPKKGALMMKTMKMLNMKRR